MPAVIAVAPPAPDVAVQLGDSPLVCLGGAAHHLLVDVAPVLLAHALDSGPGAKVLPYFEVEPTGRKPFGEEGLARLLSPERAKRVVGVAHLGGEVSGERAQSPDHPRPGLARPAAHFLHLDLGDVEEHEVQVRGTPALELHPPEHAIQHGNHLKASLLARKDLDHGVFPLLLVVLGEGLGGLAVGHPGEDFPTEASVKPLEESF